MKVLYISHHREATGVGQAARDYIQAMDSVGIDVVCRAVRLNAPLANLSQRILELEQKDAHNVDVCIQHVLPTYFVRGPFKKNVALVATETGDYSSSGWPNHINQMDELWVINEQAISDATRSGVTIPIKVVPHAFDNSKYREVPPLYQYKEFSGLNTPEYLFYTIGEFTQRKNFPALIRAFHIEFDPSEPVNLLIKTNSHIGPNELQAQFQNMCGKIKEDLRLYPNISDYKRELVIVDYLTDDQILGLHKIGNCFVCPSYGEAWNIPCFDAMALGNSVIYNDVGGMRDYLAHYSGAYAVGNNQTCVSAVKDTLPNLFTGNDFWWNIDIHQLRIAMRWFYNNFKSKIDGRSNASKYSYNKIGTMIKELIGG